MSPVGLRVFHFDRLAHCDKRLVDFFAWWQIAGPFPLTIPATGGLRHNSLEQARLFELGVTRAKSLQDTPHGRGAAVDAYPAILDPTGTYVVAIHRSAVDQDDVDRFATYGELAQKHGLEWGGSWPKFKDLPHVQCPNWRELPYPPQGA